MRVRRNKLSVDLNLWSAYINGALGLGGLWGSLALLAQAGSATNIAGVLGVGVGESLLLARRGVQITSSLGCGGLRECEYVSSNHLEKWNARNPLALLGRHCEQRCPQFRP